VYPEFCFNQGFTLLAIMGKRMFLNGRRMLSSSADIRAKEMAQRSGPGGGKWHRKAGQKNVLELPPQTQPGDPSVGLVIGGNHDPSREPGVVDTRVGADDGRIGLAPSFGTGRWRDVIARGALAVGRRHRSTAVRGHTCGRAK